ncbi:MAG: AarF/ABC1/UbiB kinase family protein [Chloroflexaceae bacterium]|nr:AarF/ABC1/UbiB kinase family protein [Chloroflexaceae bacterium]NJO05981.1 AarF/ABC1/UbiB kinase family protein [Chloroflexaceae bacterium]
MPTPEYHPRKRFFRVLTFFLGVVIHVYIWDIFLFRNPLLRWYVQRSAVARWAGMAREFRKLALELGGIHIKLGQFISSRADIVPDVVRHELADLQDEVPAAPFEEVYERILTELGRPIEDVFAEFETNVVAAASLGQVYFGKLYDGREVAIKVQRLNIDEIIEIDLSAITWVVKLIKDYRPIRRRADLMGLLEEFARVLRLELDYTQEARNAAIFRTNFANTPGVYVPEPVPELTTHRLLVIERIYGIKLNNLKGIEAAGISRLELAERLNSTYLKQFFLDGFFHADPHPGNLFVRVEPELPISAYTNGHSDNKLMIGGSIFGSEGENKPGQQSKRNGTPFTLIFIDFGMVGYLTAKTMEHLREGVIGLATNDADRIVRAMVKANMLLPGADLRPITQAVQVMMRYSYDRTVRELNNIDVEAIFDETKELVYELPFQLPQDLLYLGRAMSMVGGLATALEPDINLFESLRPFTRDMVARQQREADWVAQVQKEFTEIGQILVTLPRQMDAYYKAANRGELQTITDMSRLERGMRRVERSTDRLTGGMLATGLFIGGVQLRALGRDKDADRAWWAAVFALLWSMWPRGERR